MTEEPENNETVEAAAETGSGHEPAAVTETPVEAEDTSPPAGSAPPAQPAEVLTPKERRVRARAARAANAPQGGSRTAEERQAERDEARKRKAAARRTERQRARAKYKAGEHERVATPPREHTPGVQKLRQGIVVSDKADKTITVRIDVARRHRRYEKIVRTSGTVHAHDERNDAHVGDTVVVRECRPLSRTKRWRLVEVVERAK